MIVLPDAENRTIVSLFIWTKHFNVSGGLVSSELEIAVTKVEID